MAELKLSDRASDLAYDQQLSFCVFHKTEEKLKTATYARLLSGFFSAQERSHYRSLSDLLFCELFAEWKTPCLNFYNGRGGRLFSFSEVSPKSLLEWDQFLAEVVLARLKELYLKGRRRWPSVVRELKVPAPPKKSKLHSATLEKLPRSLMMNRSCSEALELARLRGVLFRHIHELVESARFDDPVWLNRAISNVKNFVESLPSSSFGAQLASKILLERLRYVQSLPQYDGVRTKLLALLQEYSYDRARLKQKAKDNLLSRTPFKVPPQFFDKPLKINQNYR